jgi:hypothetical protein
MIYIPPANAAAILSRLSLDAQDDTRESRESKDNTLDCGA